MAPEGPHTKEREPDTSWINPWVIPIVFIGAAILLALT